MLPSWCQDAVTVLRAPVVVRNGREHRDWTQAEPHDLTGCSLQPSSTETGFDGARRDASASAARLLCPPGSDIREHDRVVAASRTWEVDGVPLGVSSPTGRASNLSVMLREWRG